MNNNEFHIKDLIKDNEYKNKLFIIEIEPKNFLFANDRIYLNPLKSDFYLVPCKIIEDRYKVAEGYKVSLKPIDEYSELFGRRDFYQTDFNSLVNDGHIIIVNENEKIKIKPYKINKMISSDGFPLIVEEGYEIEIYREFKEES